jgi:acyl dehydratase
MPIPASLVGSMLGPRSIALTPRFIMAFAAATGDFNTCYFDDTRDAVVAPPLLAVSLEWPLVLGLRASIPEATEAELRRGVHATHDLTVHRLPRAGETLFTSGTVVSLARQPAGTRLVTRLDTVDGEGNAVFTSYNGGVYRGVALTGDERSIDEPQPLPQPPAEGGWTVQLEVPVGAAHVYSECADIWNPIHTERSVARAAGLPDIILHGTATLGYAAQEIVNRACEGNPHRLRRLAGRFGAMVFMGQPLTISAGVPVPAAGGLASGYAVTTADGGPAIRDGVAIVSDVGPAA